MADYAIHEETLTDVADVIRKKDGTSALIDPADYADRINLMGMLEEKTVSGAIATFADGADAVPLKSLVANLPASLTPYEEVNIIHAGKNLWEFGDNTVDTVAYIMLYFSKPLPAGTYTVSCELISTTTTCSFRFRKEDGSYLVQTSFTANAGRVSKTLTLPEPAYRVYLYSSTQGSGEVTTWKNVQIEVGSSASDYEPYEEPTTYDVEIPNPNPNLRPSADIDDGMWTTNGTINPSSGGGFGRALTMAVSEKTSYDIYGLLDDLVVYLDSNKTMLSYERLSNTSLSLQNERKTTPANCAYIGLSALAFDVSSVSVKESFLVYGGSIEVISGDGESTRGLALDFSTLRSGGTSSTGAYRYMLDISGIGDYNVGSCISNLLTYHVLWNSDVGEFYNMSNSLVIFLAQDNVSDAISYLQSNSCKIVYPLASPESFSVSPIPVNSKAGTNNIWNDSSGDTSVTYRSQGTAYIYPNAEEASF